MSGTELTHLQNEVVENPFAGMGSQIVKAGRGSVQDTQMAAQELGGIQARVTLAKRFGRDPATSYDRIMTACQRLGLASVAIYSYSRGGSAINGPSIRLAEEIVRDWGNVESGWVELERGEHESTVRAYAWDLETNAYKQIVFVVPLQRTKKNRAGNGYITVPLTDERDIYELLANNAARRMRNCILALIPGDIVEAAVEQCHKTLVTKCEINNDRLKKMVAAFEAFGVTKNQIEARIQRKLESIAPAQFVRLTEIYNSLKDGMSEPADWFEPETVDTEQITATDSLKAKLVAHSTTAPKAEEALFDIPAPEAPKSAPDAQGDLLGQTARSDEGNTSDGQPESLYQRLAAKIKRTRTKAGLQTVYNSVRAGEQNGELTETEAAALNDLIEEQSL